jgi:rhodanese-related sulfurtransferase
MKRAMTALFIILFALASGSVYFAEAKGDNMEQSVFDKVAGQATLKDGVKEITYDQFMEIRKSGEKYVLLDVLPPSSYAKGHIEGAVSFPGNTINKETCASRLKKDDKIIVYCGSFQCGASTHAAKTLIALGYNVLDYKGGLKDWQDKGNSFVKS